MFGNVTKSEVKNLINYEITELKLEIAKLKTHINSLRGLFNKTRTKFLDELEEEDPKKETSKKDDMLVPI